MNLDIRAETDADLEAIRQVNRLAFEGDDEGRLVDALRQAGLVDLSLVAELDGEVVGHICLSAIEIVADGDIRHAALALAPMAVLPEHQRQGIGTALVEAGLRQCRRAGHTIVIVVGHPAYYPRFGFSAELAARLASPYSGEACMALELVPGALAGVSGEVRYSQPFLMA